MYAMPKKYLSMLLCCSVLAAACSEERPARSVQEFLDNPQFLEAAVVRCSVNRAESRYEAECVNARQAVAIIEAREERARRDRLELESEQKRDALRRTQRAAAAARREAAERARRQEEAEYLAQFGVEPPAEDERNPLDLEANTPGAVIPSPEQAEESHTSAPLDEPNVVFDAPAERHEEALPASDGGNAPVVNNEPAADLNSIRDELKRRQEDSDQ